MENKFLAEWVSVEERLPMHGKEVSIKDEFNGIDLGVGYYRVNDMAWGISGSVFYNPTHWLELLPITDSNRQSLPLPNQKLWEMAKIITERQKATLKANGKLIDWRMLEGDWFDWLEESIFGESTFRCIIKSEK